MPHLPVPAQHETLDRRRFGAHLAVRVQAGGGGAYLMRKGTKKETEVVKWMDAFNFLHHGF
ncbi:MAG TPA: hypothetical protein VNE18_07270 [Rhodanobacter sp.]|nr:hypothetical protein [Rhodanobacter sp.]